MKSLLLITFFIAVAQSLNLNSLMDLKVPLKASIEASRKMMKAFASDPNPSMSLLGTVNKDCVKQNLNLKHRDYLVTGTESAFILTTVTFVCASDVQLTNTFNYDLMNVNLDAPVISHECLELRLSKLPPTYSILRNLNHTKSDQECSAEIAALDAWELKRKSNLMALSNFPPCSDEYFDVVVPMDTYFMMYLQKRQLLPAEKFGTQMEYVAFFRNFAQKTINCIMAKLNAQTSFIM